MIVPANAQRIDGLVASAYGDPGNPGIVVRWDPDDVWGEATRSPYGLAEDDLVATSKYAVTTWGEVKERAREVGDERYSLISESEIRIALIEEFLDGLCLDAEQTDWFPVTDSGGRVAYLTLTRGDGGVIVGADGPFVELPEEDVSISREAVDGQESGVASMVQST